jgi:hypothetical protein
VEETAVWRAIADANSLSHEELCRPFPRIDEWDLDDMVDFVWLNFLIERGWPGPIYEALQ